MAKSKTEELAKQLSEPILDQLGYELVDIEYKKEGGSWFLRFYIDKNGGITIDDCQNFSERISKVFDEVDPIPNQYYLEVSSPGLDRPLKRDKDFEQYKGYKVDLKLYKPINGIKKYSGELVGLEGGNIIVIKDNNNILSFNRQDVAIIRLAIEF
ncbi:MAG: ribosome maturation factor RimP [Xylanivirga thermophila]|jgi:ribosome maturation factor RimP|uniref:ribosome maturation factor RimP n=1 Tax=Xylanivirga thermophila TaxID=2496273 RepID=UPI0039F586E2